MSFYFQKQPPEMFSKKVFRKTSVLGSLFNKVPCLQACNSFKNRLQHRCFLVKFTKFLRTHILKNICERLLCIFYVLHKYVSHVQKNGQMTSTKFITFLQGFHIIANFEYPSKNDFSDSKENGSQGSTSVNLDSVRVL